MAIVYGITECTTYLGAEKYRIHIDQAYDSESAIVKARPDLFSSMPDRVGGVEAATAVPGEKRRAGRPAKST